MPLISKIFCHYLRSRHFKRLLFTICFVIFFTCFASTHIKPPLKLFVLSYCYTFVVTHDNGRIHSCLILIFRWNTEIFTMRIFLSILVLAMAAECARVAKVYSLKKEKLERSPRKLALRPKILLAQVRDIFFLLLLTPVNVQAEEGLCSVSNFVKS